MKPIFTYKIRKNELKIDSSAIDAKNQRDNKRDKIIKNKYEALCFTIQKWHVEREFNNQKVENAVLPAKLKFYMQNKHVVVIERSIQEIKEHKISTLQGLPYKRMPKLMIQELLAGFLNAINAFLNKCGIRTTANPGTLVDEREKLLHIFQCSNFSKFHGIAFKRVFIYVCFILYECKIHQKKQMNKLN